MRASTVTVIVPFHNEAGHIERVMSSLRMQRRPCDVILVDNASSDGGSDLVRRCPEVQNGSWTLVDEPQIGKFFALGAGVRVAKERGADYIGVIDADSFVNPGWTTELAVALSGADDIGYVYGPLRYADIGSAPTFRRAYCAYNATAEWLMERIIWFAPGSNAVFSTSLFERYLANGIVSTELDFRPSALALWEGLSARLNRTPVFSSARRIFATQEHFEAWCFYRHEYYRGRDINAETKTDLTRRLAVGDLRSDQIPRLFKRRATRIVCRNLIPLAFFDRRGIVRQRIRDTFGVTLCDRPQWDRYRNVETILSAAFGAFAEMVESDEADGELVRCVEDTMWRFYRESPGRDDGFDAVSVARNQ